MKLKKLVAAVIALLALSSCGKLHDVLDAALVIPDKMDTLNTGMGKTNEAIRLQKLAVALDQLMKKENQMFLAPIPGDMMAPGKLLAETLTAYEATELIYVKLTNVNENTYRDHYPEDAALENKAQIQEFERSKLALYYALQIVSTFLPDQVIGEMVEKEVLDGGRHEKTVLSVLMMRATFYDKVMLKSSVLKDKMKTVGFVKNAIEYNEKIDVISRYKFANSIEIKITGFLNQEINEQLSQKLDLSLAARNWATIKARAQSEVEFANFYDQSAEDQARIATQTAQLKNYLNKIDGYMATWPATSPELAPEEPAAEPSIPGVEPAPAPDIAPSPAPDIAPSPAPDVAPSPAPDVAPSPAPAPDIAPAPAPEPVPAAPDLFPTPARAPNVAPAPQPEPTTPACENSESENEGHASGEDDEEPSTPSPKKKAV